MKEIDRLFNDTLSEHSTPVPTGLWSRVEVGVPAPSISRLWLRAAAVLVPAIIAGGLWLGVSHEEPSVISQNQVEPSGNHFQASENTLADPAPTAVAAPTKTKDQEREKKPTRNQPIVKEVPATQTGVSYQTAPDVAELIVPEAITIEPLQPETEIAAVPEPTKPIVIEFTLEPISQPEVRKETSLERVVEFARAVKHSDPISDIRGLKDEFFAFDFRKKQQKKN